MVRRVDYDEIASTYDRRYDRNAYPGTENTLRGLCADPNAAILEVGCGTGHWLHLFEKWGQRAIGLDLSQEMLDRAPRRVARGRAEALPFGDACFDGIACVNALHHFDVKSDFIAEARRTLRPGRRLMVIGLDPHVAASWFIYEYFEETLDLDLARYPSGELIRSWMNEAGFVDCSTTEAERISKRMPARRALARGLVDKAVTSQLAILSDREYKKGIARIEAAADAAEKRGEDLELWIDLPLYVTAGNVPK
jgi:SAM-dependent methyltransferase